MNTESRMGTTSASAARTAARMTKNASLVSSIDATLDLSVAPFIPPNVAPVAVFRLSPGRSRRLSAAGSRTGGPGPVRMPARRIRTSELPAPSAASAVRLLTPVADELAGIGAVSVPSSTISIPVMNVSTVPGRCRVVPNENSFPPSSTRPRELLGISEKRY